MELETVDTVLNSKIIISSIAGIGTAICIPSLGICFDVGVFVPEMIDASHVFITHCHMDHIAAIGQHLLRRDLLRKAVSSYIVPDDKIFEVQQMLKQFDLLNEKSLKYEVLSIDILMAIEKGLVQAFPTDHNVPSQGYIVSLRKSQLKPEISKIIEFLPKEEKTKKIRELLSSGIEIKENVYVPYIAYTGDTKIDAILARKDVLSSQLLIMECTYLDSQNSVEKARERYHIHLDEIAASCDKFRNEAIILTHISQRYTKTEVFQLIYEKIPEQYRDKFYIGIEDRIYKLAQPKIFFHGKSNEYGFLSNFFPAPFDDEDGRTWPTSEHYYQAHKYVDPKKREEVRLMKTPFETSYHTNHQDTEIRADWSSVKDEIMKKALHLKFKDPQLAQMLIDTRPYELVERTEHDSYWGTGSDGKGENRLGKMLVQLRDQL